MAQRAFLGKLLRLQEKIEQVQPNFLGKMATFVVKASPDDTGAYVLSHTIGASSNVGLSMSSRNRPSAPNTHGGDALQKLMGQAAAVPVGARVIGIGNNSPHSSSVEFGGPNWRRGGYYVYTQLDAVARDLLKDAIREAGLK